MCHPGVAAAAGVLGAVVSIASTAVEYEAAWEDYENRAVEWQQNYTSAVAAKQAEENQLNLRMMEEEEAFVQRRHATALEGAQARASAELSAAQAGLAGISMDNVKIGIARQTAAAQDSEASTYRATVAQLGREKESATARAKNRINSIQIPNQPNPLAFVLKGFGSALGHVGSLGALA